MVAKPRVRIYTTPWCPYCVSARRLLAREGIRFVEHDVSRDPALRRQVSRQTGWRTVPMIFIDDTFVGGYDELAKLKAAGGLSGLTA